MPDLKLSGWNHVVMNAQQYYGNSAVRDRIVEFLGGSSLETATSVFVAHGSVGMSRKIFPQNVNTLDELLGQGLDIARSLWDRSSLLLHLDIEYVNFDVPAEPYLDPMRAFELQKPVIDAFLRILGTYGIEPLHLLSGRGHHLVWRISRGSQAFMELMEFGHLSEGIESFYRRNPVLGSVTVAPSLARAYAGSGVVVEYLTDRVIREAGPQSAIPVTITDLEVVPQHLGREVVSIDVSEYSDPLSTRMIRIAFSVYTKPIRLEHENREQLLLFVPLHGITLSEGLSFLKSPGNACRLAENAGVRIPESEEGTRRLISDYRRSLLAGFHNDFYSVSQSSERNMYERTSFEGLPGCVESMLLNPDKRLLRPAVLQLVVRSLYGAGWHPQHIAGLIRSLFERKGRYGEEWEFYSPATRADFYVRALAGAIATGVDTLDDFNCSATKDKGYCGSECNSHTMDRLRAAALSRRPT